jgi:hypothetical protein
MHRQDSIWNRQELREKVRQFPGITVIQSLFAALTSFLIQKRDLLKAWVIIYAYNQHVRLFSPSL